MAKQVRRVVTGHDPDGKAIVISDGPAPFVHVNAVNPEWYSTDIWRTKETPARINAPSAISRAASSLTAPWLVSVCWRTPSSSSLATSL